jgi:uncharacterized protein (DUF2237 family)
MRFASARHASFWRSASHAATISPRPQWGFAGVKPGDQWCLCADRWKEALDAGMAPPVVLEATHQAALRHVTLEDLLFHALTSPTA